MTENKCPSGLRIREGTWHYRFKHQGHEWTGSTGLVATKRNESAALSELSKARELVRTGRASQLSLQAKSFTEGSVEFLKWAKGEHKDHPNTATRLKTSFASLNKFFGNTPVHSITANSVKQFMTWRRLECNVQEITIRHDLHALSPFFKYAMDANWCRENPVEKVKIPSAEDAVREHVVTLEEERQYFAAALTGFEIVKDGKKGKRGPFQALHDVGRIILDQGMRPDEAMKLRVEHVDMEKGFLRVAFGKSKAAKRQLDMTPEVRAILARRIAGRIHGWIFPGKNPEKALTKLNGPHDAVIEKIGASFVMYEFRHTFATRFGESVGDPIALAALLGHASLKMVMKYCHPQASHTSQAMKRFIDSRKPAEIAEVRPN